LVEGIQILHKQNGVFPVQSKLHIRAPKETLQLAVNAIGSNIPVFRSFLLRLPKSRPNREGDGIDFIFLGVFLAEFILGVQIFSLRRVAFFGQIWYALIGSFF